MAPAIMLRCGYRSGPSTRLFIYLLRFKPNLGKPSDRFRPVWQVILLAPPEVYGLKEIERKPYFKPCGLAPIPSPHCPPVIGRFFYSHDLELPCEHPIVLYLPYPTGNRGGSQPDPPTRWVRKNLTHRVEEEG